MLAAVVAYFSSEKATWFRESWIFLPLINLFWDIKKSAEMTSWSIDEFFNNAFI